MGFDLEIFYGILYSANITYEEIETTKYNENTGNPYLVKNKITSYTFPNELEKILDKLREEYTNKLSGEYRSDENLDFKISNTEIYVGRKINTIYFSGFNGESEKLSLGSKEEILEINEKLSKLNLKVEKANYFIFYGDYNYD